MVGTVPVKPIGLQSGIDISPLVDLDELLSCDRDPAAMAAFLTLVAFKHACPDLAPLKSWSVDEFQEYLSEEVFDEMDTYVQLARSSEGNPRDFLRIVSACCSTVKQASMKIPSKSVNDQAAKHFANTKAPSIAGDEAANQLFDRLFQKVVANRCKLFVITKRKAEADPLIFKLWHYRFIHLVEEDYTVIGPQGGVTAYSIYSMDYGKLLSLKATKAGQEILNTILRVTDLPGAGIVSLLGDFMAKSPLGARLFAKIGAALIDRAGTEIVDTTIAETLVPKCVVDDLMKISD